MIFGVLLMKNVGLAVGKVDTKRKRFNFDLDVVKWQTRRVHNLDNCRECAHVLQCGGGCANDAYNRCGTIMTGACNMFRETFNRILPLLCREAWSKERTEEMSRSWRELLSKFDVSDRQTLLKTNNPQRTLDTWKKVIRFKEMPDTY